jgi:hypothetical protein
MTARLQEWQRKRRIGRKPPEKHLFRAHRVGRVAVSALKNGDTKVAIVAEVLKALGYDDVFCQIKKTASSLSVISVFLKQVLAIVAEAAALRVLVAWLTSAVESVPMPLQVKLAAGGGIFVFTAVSDIIGALNAIVSDIDELKSVADDLPDDFCSG